MQYQLIGNSSKKILFIVEKTILVMILKMKLELIGYKIILAYNGEEGLKTVQEEDPDFIILDAIAPKIDGLKLCRRMKGDPKTKNIPIIMASDLGEVKENLSKKCRAAGANDVIIKPLESDKLLDKITKLI